MNKLKYKVGDKVRIKSLDWYNENKDELDQVKCGDYIFTYSMTKLCGKTVTIRCVNTKDCYYVIYEDDGYRSWTDEMIEGLVEEETKPKYEDEVNGEYYSTPKYLVRPSGYQFVDENGNVINALKIVLEKKKTKYPTTYEGCCFVLHEYPTQPNITGYKYELLHTFRKLLICRDAYWKIAGEEMGLGKPWEPDYDSGVNKYGIICLNGVVQESNPTTNWERHLNKVLDFPTAEMRDAFKENFDPDIEFCKEFL